MSRKRIVVMGFMAGIPVAGVVWQHLHYIVGLQRLGYEVFYCEDSARLVYHPGNFSYGTDWSYVPGLLDRLGRRFGFEGRWGFCARFLPDQPTAGLSREKIRDLIRTADAALNICGTQEIHEELQGTSNLIYVESDPGLEQVRLDNGDDAPREYLDRHRALFTFGENIGSAEFPVPLHGCRWLPTRQPVVTDLWKASAPPPSDAVFTTIANWNTSGLKDIEWRGDKYHWSKSLEFLRFADAPARIGEPVEMATNIKDTATRTQLESHGWRLIEATPISDDLDAYVRYIQQSRGEFTVAKDQYVRLHTGWFSDRTACYLAAGRPVITQETGLSRHLPTGRGLLTFRTAEEIAEAAKSIRADYAAHCRAAHEVAVEYFEATKVVASILERAGV